MTNVPMTNELPYRPAAAAQIHNVNESGGRDHLLKSDGYEFARGGWRLPLRGDPPGVETLEEVRGWDIGRWANTSLGKQQSHAVRIIRVLCEIHVKVLDGLRPLVHSG